MAVAPRHCRHHNPLPGEGLELQQAGDCGLEDEARQEIKKAEQPGQLTRLEVVGGGGGGQGLSEETLQAGALTGE